LWPEAKLAAMSKYVGREHLLQVVIPKLECMWGDGMPKEDKRNKERGRGKENYVYLIPF